MKKRNTLTREFRLFREFRRFQIGHARKHALGRNAVDTRIVQNTKLGAFYKEYLATQDTSEFIHKVGRLYTRSTLLRLAQADHVESRRAAVLALTYLGDYEANEVFGRLLHDEDRTVRLLAEIGIKNLWPRIGTDQQRQKLRSVMRLIASDHFEEAIAESTELLEEMPDFAEAWNQRALARFAQKRFEDAIEDATLALECNPFHFGAAIGRGHAYLQLRQWISALESFQYALEVNPNLQQVRKTIAQIEQWIS